MKILSALLFLVAFPAQNIVAQLTPIIQADFVSDATTVDFETNTSALPSVTGLTFVQEVFQQPFFSGFVAFGVFGDSNAWTNGSSLQFTNLGAEFDTPVEAIGGFFGRIENFRDEHVVDLEMRALDSNSNEIGITSIALPLSLIHI